MISKSANNESSTRVNRATSSSSVAAPLYTGTTTLRRRLVRCWSIPWGIGNPLDASKAADLTNKVECQRDPPLQTARQDARHNRSLAAEATMRVMGTARYWKAL